MKSDFQLTVSGWKCQRPISTTGAYSQNQQLPTRFPSAYQNANIASLPQFHAPRTIQSLNTVVDANERPDNWGELSATETIKVAPKSEK
jgi:hypothetical protein